MALTWPVRPMKATLGSVPPNDGADAGGTPRWAYEVKWDGHRTIAHVGGGRARLQTTSGLDSSDRWPEVVAMGDAVNASMAILDGEMVVIGEDGRPRFDLVQQRDATLHPAVFHAFDVLSIGGTDTIELPYVDRRRLLAELLEPGDHWQVPAHRVGGGAELLAATADQGLEGIIAKRLASLYRPGARSRDWLKVKNRRRVEVTIGGYTTGSGSRADTFGALLVGIPHDADARDHAAPLRFAGGVGTGFNQQVLDELAARLRRLTTDTCPFEPEPPASIRKGASWVEPTMRAEIEIAEFTNEGQVRQASYLGLVDD